MKQLEFWLSLGSPYTYLTVMRLPEIVQKTGLEVEWRVFSLRKVMSSLEGHPFSENQPKAKYMWDDIGRRAAKYGLSPRLPAPFPLDACDLANRVALVADQEGRLRDFVIASFRRWFHDGHPAGAEPNLSHSLTEVGLNPDKVIRRAESAAIERAFEKETSAARERGIFGAPSFVVDGELFWGDDRLNDAVAFAIPQPKARVMKKSASVVTQLRPKPGPGRNSIVPRRPLPHG
ncbi:2-hydroxychromene-2-carboxylate isomerase [Nioella nitratireducens]|uniref:2-hydroxychromene-2-carboxylate isomerase n=1 Tax=Nioella nitratireducens TaxID=1287720 RepID=UPI0008FD3345|nr:2-hydroxychromene-2-carboxylate isomerase [Nioella nitratireducens]